MPELPKVSQEFDADAAPYLAAIQAMIDKAEEFVAANKAVVDSINDIGAAIRALPDDKIITVTVKRVYEGNAPDVGAQTQVIRQRVIPGEGGWTGGATGGFGSGINQNIDQLKAAAEAFRQERAAAGEAQQAVAGYSASLERAMEDARLDNEFINQLNRAYGENSVAAKNMTAAQAELLNVVLEELAASSNYRDNVDGLTVQLGTAGRVAKETAADYNDLIASMQKAEQTTGPWLSASRETDAALKKSSDTLAIYNKAMEENAVASIHMAGMEAAGANDTAALGRAMGNAAQMGKLLATSTDEVGHATSGAVPFTAALTNGWGFFITKIQLWAGLMPGILGHIQGWHIALDGLFEAFIAIAGALIAFTVGAVALQPALNDIKDHLTSVRDVSKALGQNIAPLNGQFNALAHSLAPQAVELYGGALNTIGKNLPVLGQTAHQVAGIFTDWMAKIDIWAQKSGTLAQILHSGTGFLSQFGQMIGNILVAIDNLIRADPGTAHFLLDFLIGATNVLKVITQLPQPILYAALAFHSIWLWGGLAANGIAGLLIPIRGLIVALGGLKAADTAMANLGKDASGISRLKAVFTDIGSGLVSMGLGVAAWAQNIIVDMRKAQGATATFGAAIRTGLIEPLALLAASPWTWAIIGVAALAALVYEWGQAGQATKNYIATQQQAVQGMTASQAIFGGVSQTIGNLDTKMGQLGDASVKTLAASSSGFTNLNSAIASFGSNPGVVVQTGFWKQLGSGILGAAKNLSNYLNFNVQGKMQQDANSINAYHGAIVNLTTDQTHLFQAVGYTMKANGYSFQQSVAIMDLAGIQAGDSFDLMKHKIDNLITGYKNLGVQGALLASAVNAVTFSTYLADTKVSAITQGFSQFIQVLTSGESTMLTFAAGLLGLTNAASGATTTLTTTNGVTRLTTRELSQAAAQAGATGASMNGLGTNSIALRQAFENQINTGATAINSMYTLSAATASGKQGMQQITQGTKDYVATLLPFAQGSAQATAQLMGLAQMGGGPAYDATKSLAQNFKILTTWVGNVKDPMGQLNTILGNFTIKAGNLATDVQNMAAAINQNLNQAMASAIVQANGGQQAFDNFATAVKNSGGDMSNVVPAAKGLYKALVGDLAGNMPQVEATFKSFAQYGLKLTQAQADQLWKDISGTGVPALKGAAAAAGTTGKALDNLRDPHIAMLNSAMSTWTAKNGEAGTMVGHTLPAHLGNANAALDAHRTAHLTPVQQKMDDLKGHTSGFGLEVGVTMPGHIGTANAAMNASKNGPMAQLNTAIGGLASAVRTMASVFSGQWPKNESTNVALSGSGGAQVKQSGGSVTVIPFARAGGGMIPGYAPGVDSVHALLSPGEAVLIPQAARMLGGEQGIHQINQTAKHFASGGMVTSMSPITGLFGSAHQIEQAGKTDIVSMFTNALNSAYSTALGAAKNSVMQAAAALAAKYAGQGGSNQQNIALGSRMAGAYGWSGIQFLDLAALWTKESGWSSVATNPTSGAAGIAQNISGYSAGYQKGNAAQQIAWGLAYIKSRYGSPAAAWAHETAFNWYDNGGLLMPGLTLAYNGTGKPEQVVKPGGNFQGIDPGGPMHLHNYIDVKMDGQTVWRGQQTNTFKYNVRNSGKATGIQKPI